MMEGVNEDIVKMKTLVIFKKDKVGLRMRMSLSKDQTAKIPIRTAKETAFLLGRNLMA